MKSSRVHYASLMSSLLFAISALIFFAAGFILGLSALIALLQGNRAAAQASVLFGAMSFLGSILLIATVVAFMKYLNKPAVEVSVPTSASIWQIGAGAIGAGLALLLGGLIQDNNNINWLFLPVLTIPAVTLPIWVVTGMGVKNLPLDSRWRTWSILGISLTLAPFILFVLEFLIVVFIVLFVVIYALASPELMVEFQRLSSQLMFIDPESEAAMQILAPYLTRPGVVFVFLTVFSVFIPVIEELIKPLGVWLFAGKLNSTAQGFAFGALSGAGFALIETFNVSGQTAEWSGLLFSRIGTGTLHITTSALMGGAIFTAWHERRYLRLIGTYLLAILLHGLWNAGAVAYSFSALLTFSEQPGDHETMQLIATSGMIVLVIVLFAILITSNQRLRKTLPVEHQNDSLPAGNEPSP